MQGVSGCIHYDVRVDGIAQVPVTDSHVTAGSQDELVLVRKADVYPIHTVLRSL